jgi:uncharacterized protein (DUF433 family)
MPGVGMALRDVLGEEVKMQRISSVASDPEILGGIPVFVGTRVPVQTLLDYLVASETTESFLEDFHTVRQEQVVAVLEELKSALVASYENPT